MTETTLGNGEAGHTEGKPKPNWTIDNNGKRTYSREFKAAIGARFQAGESSASLQKETGAHPTSIRRWSRGEDMSASAPRRNYTDELKMDAVRRVSSGENWRAVGRELGVSSGMISAWKRRFAKRLKEDQKRKEALPVPKVKMFKKQTIRARFEKAALARIAKGETPKKAAKALGIQVANIYDWISKTRKAKALKTGAFGKKGQPNLKANGLGVAVGKDAPPYAVVAHLPAQVRDAVSLLKHAESAIYVQLNAGKIKKLGEVELLVLQALRSLSGE
jgi:transposase-like protein